MATPTPDDRLRRAAALTAARRADSAAKQNRTLNAIERLGQAGGRITFAREADVSTWLLYNVPDVRTAAEAAIAENARLRDRLRRTLGAEIDQSSRAELIEQIQRQQANLRAVTAERDAARSENQTVRPQVQDLREQVQAQQDLNRGLMRQINHLKRP